MNARPKSSWNDRGEISAGGHSPSGMSHYFQAHVVRETLLPLSFKSARRLVSWVGTINRELEIKKKRFINS